MTKRQHPERDEQTAIVQLLKLLGASVYVLGVTRRRSDYQGTMMSAGLPDLWAVLPLQGSLRAAEPRSRIPLWIEVKAPSGRTSEPQAQFRAECLASQVPHILGGLADVESWLRKGGWLK